MTRSLCIVAALLAWVAPVRAESAFTLRAYGSGFRDPTPVAPVGGNPGTTRGEQRRLALQFAADIWGKLLDSNVPIEVLVDFAPQGCGSDSTLLASANAAGVVIFDNEPIGEPGLAYPYALANRLAGVDLDPSSHDIAMSVNTSVDDECRTASLRGFYYGLDGRGPPYLDDLVSTVLHELGHGLGFLSTVGRQDGEPEFGALDVYSAHLRDLDLGRSWQQLSGAQRVASMRNPRRVVLDGPRLNAAAASFLTAGTPALSFTPPVEGFHGLVADTAFAPNSARAPVAGQVAEVLPAPGCMGLLLAENASGRIAFVDDPHGSCRVGELVQAAQNAGALGVLLPYASSGYIALPPPARTPEAHVPVLALSEGDAEAVRAALARGPLSASLGGNASQLLGADASGRVLVFTPNMLAPGSSLSHFDVSARPDLLMEPYSNGAAQHGVDLTLALLRDLGWTSLCGNGVLDYGEECDAAQQNGDGAGAPCRSSCLLPGCGDGLLDANEACDQGRDNSDSLPNACRTSCVLAHCGDGVLDPSEACDEGAPDGGTGTCTPACQLMAAVEAGVADAGAPMEDAAPMDDSEPKLRQWGEAQLTPPRRAPDDGCQLAHGSSALPGLGLLLLALVRRRR